MQFIFILFKSPLFRGALVALAVAAFLGWAYLAVHNRGVSACEGRHQVADAQAAEEQHQSYLAEVARGQDLSRKLAETQRRLNDTQAEYLAYANGITGNCPAALGVLNNAAVSGEGMPKTPGAPADPAAAIGAADIARNIAENYARCHLNAAQLAALIDWHRPEEAVKHE